MVQDSYVHSLLVLIFIKYDSNQNLLPFQTWVPHKRTQIIRIQCKPNKQFLSSFQTMVMKKFEETIAAKDSTENGNSSSLMEEISNKKQRIEGPFVMPLISIPKLEEQSSNASIVLSGTAKKGEIGPPLGTVDIGVSKSAYFFQVALPGVKKDPGLFSYSFYIIISIAVSRFEA